MGGWGVHLISPLLRNRLGVEWSRSGLAASDTLLCCGHILEYAISWLSGWPGWKIRDATVVGALSLQRLVGISTDQLRLVLIAGELLLEANGRVAGHPSAAGRLLKIYRHFTVDATGFTVRGEPAGCLVEAGSHAWRRVKAWCLVWNEGLFADWVIGVGF